MGAVQRFRKMPVEIDAIQYDGTAFCAGAVVGWTHSDQGDPAYLVDKGYEHRLRRDNECDRSNGHVLEDAPPFLVIPTLEGDHRADVEDWIIRGVQGEFYPCKPEIFSATYEPVC